MVGSMSMPNRTITGAYQVELKTTFSTLGATMPPFSRSDLRMLSRAREAQPYVQARSKAVDQRLEPTTKAYTDADAGPIAVSSG